MNKLAASLLSVLLLAVAGCSKDPGTTAPPAQEPPAAASPAAAEPTAPADAAAVSEEDAIAQAPTESVTETDEAPTATDTGTVAAQPSLRVGSTAGSPTSARFKEGTHYRKLVPAQPTGVGPDKVEVIEVFWYGCPHCYTLDPAVESWSKNTKPAYVEFTRLPAMWNDQLRMHARAFYTAEMLGKLDTLHTPIFREMQVNGNRFDTAETIGAFFRQHGVSADEFQKAFSSFAVESKLQRGDMLNRRYRVQSVPTFVVNGKYTTDVGMAGGEQALFALIGELAAHEHGG